MRLLKALRHMAFSSKTFMLVGYFSPRFKGSFMLDFLVDFLSVNRDFFQGIDTIRT